MVHQHVALTNPGENVLVRRAKQSRRGGGDKWLVLQIGTVDSQQVPQPAQIQRAFDAINVVGIEFEVAHQNFDDLRAHAGMHLEAHDVAKTALPDGVLDGLQQIVALHFLNGHFRVARDVERVRFHNLKTWKQVFQVGDNQLLQPEEYVLAHGRRAVFGPGRIGRYADQLRQRIRHFHSRKVLPVDILDHCGDVQAQVRHVRKGPPRIERQRSEDRENALQKEGLHLFLLRRGEVRKVHNP